MKSKRKTKPWIKDVSKGDAKKLIKWWNGKDKQSLYFMRRDGLKTKERGRMFTIYKQPFCS